MDKPAIFTQKKKKKKKRQPSGECLHTFMFKDILILLKSMHDFFYLIVSPLLREYLSFSSSL